jgi:hypothetical protein
VNKDSAFYRVLSNVRFRSRPWRLLAIVGGSLVLHLNLASAAPLNAADVQRSEELGEAGVAAYEASDLEQARTQLEEGYRLSGWATIGLWLGKTYDKLGLTGDAYRTYVEVAASPAVAGEADLFDQARAQARQAAEAIKATSGIVQLKSKSPKLALVVSVDGQLISLTSENTLAVAPGEHTFDISWESGKLPRQTLLLAAAQTQVIELDPAGKSESKQKSATHAAVTQYLNFTLASGVEPGWTLVDSSGKVVCQLPCKWSGLDPETLTVKRGDQTLPVRLGRKLERQVQMDVSVNPRRGSKGWALGIGIPSGILFGASVVGLTNSTYRTQTPLIVSTSVFGAGFAACAWWFVWSKSRPYLEYEVAEPTSGKPLEKASIRVDWLGTGLGVAGVF